MSKVVVVRGESEQSSIETAEIVLTCAAPCSSAAQARCAAVIPPPQNDHGLAVPLHACQTKPPAGKALSEMRQGSAEDGEIPAGIATRRVITVFTSPARKRTATVVCAFTVSFSLAAVVNTRRPFPLLAICRTLCDSPHCVLVDAT
jgi:hypothetical protein